MKRTFSAFVHSSNCAFHCITATFEVHSTSVGLFTVHVAATPTNVLPAPHGRTIWPLRARPFDRVLKC